MIALVVPSIREQCLKSFLETWEGKGGWDKVVVIEDNPERTFSVQANYHFSWKEIGEALGEDAWIISRRDSACRCFGFLVAYWLGASHVLTLDDDCYPDREENIVEGHLAALASHRRWVASVPGSRTRGLPYKNLGRLDNVMANVGLWTGHPDYDAVQTLSSGAPPLCLPEGNRIIPAGQYTAVCGMNLLIARKALPLFYFPRMGEGSPYARFDDIWSGVIAKKLMDHLGWNLSVGEPFVEHRKASDPFVNLAKEAPGIGANERFWQIVDAVHLSNCGPLFAINELADALRDNPDPYIAQLGVALGIWASLFSDCPKGLKPLLARSASIA